MKKHARCRPLKKLNEKAYGMWMWLQTLCVYALWPLALGLPIKKWHDVKASPGQGGRDSRIVLLKYENCDTSMA